MLQAMNTGHEGSLTTIHANTPRDALARLETMILMAGTNLPNRAMREQISSALDVIIQVARLADGTRRVMSITEVTGMEGEVVTTQEVYRFRRRGVTPEGQDRRPVRGDRRASAVRRAPPGGRHRAAAARCSTGSDQWIFSFSSPSSSPPSLCWSRRTCSSIAAASRPRTMRWRGWRRPTKSGGRSSILKGAQAGGAGLLGRLLTGRSYTSSLAEELRRTGTSMSPAGFVQLCIVTVVSGVVVGTIVRRLDLRRRARRGRRDRAHHVDEAPPAETPGRVPGAAARRARHARERDEGRLLVPGRDEVHWRGRCRRR